MPPQIDALIIQGANNLCGTGGYFRWFTGVSMGTSYPATVIFPKDGLMTLVSHGPMGVERDFEGRDGVWRGVGKWLPTRPGRGQDRPARRPGQDPRHRPGPQRQTRPPPATAPRPADGAATPLVQRRSLASRTVQRLPGRPRRVPRHHPPPAPPRRRRSTTPQARSPSPWTGPTAPAWPAPSTSSPKNSTPRPHASPATAAPSPTRSAPHESQHPTHRYFRRSESGRQCIVVRERQAVQ